MTEDKTWVSITLAHESITEGAEPNSHKEESTESVFTSEFREQTEQYEGIKSPFSCSICTTLTSLEYFHLCQAIDFSGVTSSDSFLPRGIENPKNLCFRNVIVQSLLAVTPFRNLLRALSELCPTTCIPSPSLATWREMGFLADVFIIKTDPALPPQDSLQTPAAQNAVLDGWEETNSKSKNKKSRRKMKAVVPSSSIAVPLPPPCPSVQVLPVLMQKFMSKIRRLQSPRTTRPLAEMTSGLRISDSSPLPLLTAPSQEDAMEFMTFLLDTLHEEMTGCGPGDAGRAAEQTSAADEDTSSGWEEVTSRGGRVKKKSVDETSRQMALKETASSPVGRLFHGTIRSELKQQGKMVSATFQRFHCLNLEIRDFENSSSCRSSLSVEKALEILFSAEFISDSNSVKCSSLETLPPTLILQLNRFSFDPYKGAPIKMDAEVTYPMRLVLSQNYLTANLKMRLGSAPVVYLLVAVVVHHGNRATGGHYTALCRDQSNAWRRFDDSRVSPATEVEVLSAKKQAYLLFYCNDV